MTPSWHSRCRQGAIHPITSQPLGFAPYIEGRTTLHNHWDLRRISRGELHRPSHPRSYKRGAPFPLRERLRLSGYSYAKALIDAVGTDRHLPKPKPIGLGLGLIPPGRWIVIVILFNSLLQYARRPATILCGQRYLYYCSYCTCD
jgi:hypothetical protein